MYQSLFTSFVFAFVVAVAIGDAMWQRIPRHFTAGAVLAGIGYHAIFGGILSALVAALAGFGIGLLFFRMGAIGGGDVKLLAALGALLGLHEWGRAMFFAVLIAAVIAIVAAAMRRALMQTFRNSFALLASFPTRGFAPHETIHVRSELAVRAPFGLAAAAGTIWVLLRP